MHRHFYVLLLAILVGCSSSSTSGPATAPAGPPLSVEEAKQLIPEAAGVRIEVFEKLDNVNPDQLDDLPLTMLSLVLHEPADFRVMGDKIDPAAIVDALKRSKDKGYGSCIQPEFITDCTCTTTGDAATGTVAFKAAGLYEGKAEFTARRADGKWRIEQFWLPTDEIGVALGVDGKWKRIP